jgi:hypothetical protein
MVALIGSLLAFMAGIITAPSYIRATKPTVAVVPVQKIIPEHPSINPGTVTVPPVEASEVDFAGDLRIVPEEIKLKSERLQYDVEGRYPKIIGSDERYIDKLNQRIRKLAEESYSSIQGSTGEDLAYFRKKRAGEFNTGDLDYEIVLATDSRLSIYLNAYTYILGAAHSSQTSYVINYDLEARKELMLVDIFKSNSGYLEFIAQYCTDELSKRPGSGGYILAEGIPAKTATFKSWNLTLDGINFNFDACDYLACAAGSQRVKIPYSVLSPFMKRPLASAGR